MILQALVDFDRRQRATPGERIVPEDFSAASISYALQIDNDGALLGVLDLRRQVEGKMQPRSMPVPAAFTRSGKKPPPYLFWDSTAYVLGMSIRKPGDAKQRHAWFVELHERLLKGIPDDGATALLAFLHSWDPEHPDDLIEENAGIIDTNVCFRLASDQCWLHERAGLMPAVSAYRAERGGDSIVCLVTGVRGPLARLHPQIKNIRYAKGAKSFTPPLVSFDKDSDAFSSFGKVQGGNAPINQDAADAYGRALNALLAKGSRRRVQIADTSTVFWAERDAPVEDAFMGMLFDDSEEAPEGGQLDSNATAKIRAVVEQLGQGRALDDVDPGIDPAVRYYVLGLAPNTARISIRFWFTDTLGVLAERFRQHWLDLRLEPSRFQRPPALWQLLRETAVERKSENVPKQIAGEVMRAILTGGRYPRSLLATVIMRMRADGRRFPQADQLRCAIIKAVIIRAGRIDCNEREDRYVSLDTENPNLAYRLGRLFALLESVQLAALGRDVNATIRDKYYSAASATPAAIFPLLLRMSNHHLSKIRKEGNGGLAFTLEKRMADILLGFGHHFPKNFVMDDQGRFAIGFYHEKFTPRRKESIKSTLADQDASTQQDEKD